MSLIRRNNLFDPFSLDLWDPFEGSPFGSGSSLVPSFPRTNFETTAFTGARIDWKETPEAHVFKADVPGLKKEEVKVEAEDSNINWSDKSAGDAFQVFNEWPLQDVVWDEEHALWAAEESREMADICEITGLPEELLSAAIFRTSPYEAYRASTVSPTFRAAADSDAVRSSFLPRDLPPLANGELPSASPSKKGPLEESDHPLRYDKRTRDQDDTVAPDGFTYSIVSPCCDLGAARQVHARAVKARVFADACVGTSFVRSYAESRLLEDARKVFDCMPQRDMMSWNVLLDCYMKSGEAGSCLQEFLKMIGNGIRSDECTFATVLNDLAERLAGLEEM